MDKQTPLSIAKKWLQAADQIIRRDWASNDNTANTLVTRLEAHYGADWPVANFVEVTTVACIEAMNEWQQYKQEADRTCMCGSSLEQHSEATGHTFVEVGSL